MLTTDSWHHDDGHDHDDDDDDDGDDNDDDGGDADEHDDDDDAHDEFSVLSREWLCIHAAKAHYQNAKLYSTVVHTKSRLGHGPGVDMAMGRLLTWPWAGC